MWRRCNPIRPQPQCIEWTTQNVVADRGVVARCHFRPGQLIEQCPCVSMDHMPRGPLSNYVFSSGTGKVLSAAGLCPMYNHSDRPNARWTPVGRNSCPNSWTVVVRALRHIRPGEEILIDYGQAYWVSRKGTLKKM